jgi:hypothetical protein
MGGTSSSTQTSTSQATPYAAAQPGLTTALSGLNGLAGNAGLNATESGAINQLVSNAQGGNPYTGAIGASASGLLSGGGAQSNDAAIASNLASYRAALAPYASGSMIGNNSALQGQLDQIATDTTKQVNDAAAAAGRSGSPEATQALARGIAQGEAPVIAGQYNTDVGNQLAASNALYGAGNSTYGLLNTNQQTADNNQIAGAGQANSALQAQNYGPNAVLNAEQQAFSIPASNYTTLLGAISPIAQAFGTNTSNQTGTQTMSPDQQFATIAGGFGSLFGGNGGGAANNAKTFFRFG